MAKTVRLHVRVERKQDDLPRYVVVPDARIATWGLRATTTVIGTLGGATIGRRALKPWGDGRWSLDLPEELCRRAGLDTGDATTLVLEVASGGLPAELAALLAADHGAKAAWEALGESGRRSLREHVAEAVQPATRSRRARRGLGLA